MTMLNKKYASNAAIYLPALGCQSCNLNVSQVFIDLLLARQGVNGWLSRRFGLPEELGLYDVFR